MNPTTESDPLVILLVEDSPADVLMTREALEQNQLTTELHVVEDGIEAMEFLRRQGRHAAAPRPDLILLDLNLPRMDGREVLDAIKADESLRVIPLVVLTTSKADEDVLRAYSSHANCYVAKPLDFTQFSHAVSSIKRFWFSVATLPPG